jgi:DNA-binding GntR family transcriptional regulator
MIASMGSDPDRAIAPSHFHAEIVGALRARDAPAHRAALASDIGRAFDLLRGTRRGAGSATPRAGASR